MFLQRKLNFSFRARVGAATFPNSQEIGKGMIWTGSPSVDLSRCSKVYYSPNSLSTLTNPADMISSRNNRRFRLHHA
ncbi:hypothetical protein I7I53_00711 [Histoplasma capsulatum var. duboisii H88]|uniref:Uncharacterized protein n=1 Tax=Ajellomyces capsulatus (strain H88) TaxID=544711 RepID=A0A8A1LKD0_AJEC8|nr:hypothetical protein I7I53_00711 [Histoplasma capsulatum var. duboisii H88]